MPHLKPIYRISPVTITAASGAAAALCLAGFEAVGWRLHDRLPLPLFEAAGTAAGLALVLGALLVPFARRIFRQAAGAGDALLKAFNVSSDAICICRLDDGAILKINSTFADLTGYAEEEVVSRPVGRLELWRSRGQFLVLARRVEREGEVRDFETAFIRRDGTPVPALITASVISFRGERCILAVTRDVSALTTARETIEKLSQYDTESGLPNQNLLLDRLNQIISLNSRVNRSTAVIYVGIDGFKGIVDALGLTGSNDLVRDLARRLNAALRRTDTAARLHRDEFAIVLGGELQENDLAPVLAKLAGVFARPIKVRSVEINVTASFGIACYPADGCTAELLLQHSHMAMNQAREAGIRFRYFSASMNVKAAERLRIESGMLRSIEDGEFFLCYQPKFANNGQDITGMEALVRWGRNGEVIPPDRFIPIAEENGLIVPLGEWILTEACRQNRRWQEDGFAPLQVSVNISPRQLLQHDFPDRVEAILAQTGLPPALLELEITESAIMGSSDDIVLKLLRLKEHGIAISIDDFGTGYSSLAYLKNLPVDKIKIDRSFVMDIVSDPDDAAIVDAVISIARALNLGVIAEGVESRGQLDFLVGRNCTEFQGFYFSRPLPKEEFADLLRSRGMQERGPVAAAPRRPEAPPVLPSRRSVVPAPLTVVEYMVEVTHLIKPVAPLDRIINVLSRFQLAPDLRVLPVVEGEEIVGVVNRSTFLEEHIIGRYGFAAHINHAKKIRELMEPVALTFESTTRIEDAAASLNSRIGTLRLDNICITRNGAYVGMMDVDRFLKAMTDLQLVLAKGANPLTGLPGNTSIERTIAERLNSEIPFDIAYLDLDNFKPFNDHYGFQKGDEIIRKVAEIMTAVAAGAPEANAFCGHIGGDDFILITDADQAERLAESIVAAFDGEGLFFHGARDFAVGFYRAVNRKGEPETFPLISISVGIVNTARSQVNSYAKLASLSTEVKKAAKKTRGSAIVIDGIAA
ncbi:bifunctional diguanylate cyclase/phosphodiesterase [Geomesophilobacter sediminis]|uniref:EAL domain-containing protein n=1 Tax=Geomesophilobacter sediminis TaxID=2798584 RepID=A0A8J7JC59_9BACT|nr:EAL domain-containing protein [Geomesophilobacter sediminis]MBJ6724298.1 EAL domain-containing protein [Geomesophilobacter sediminis]